MIRTVLRANPAATAGQRRIILFLAALLALLMLPRAAPAQEETRWVLVETNVNPAGAPTEFVVGTTPNYYESPRFDGTYERYTVSPALLGNNSRSVERESVFWDVTISFTIDPPPPVLIPGETVTLRASGTASGFYADAWNPFEQFEFWAEGADLEGEAYMAVGINPDLARTSGAVAPTFVVPEPRSEEAEIHIVAGMWNCAACSVVWVYRPEIADPPDTTSSTTTSTTTTATVTVPGPQYGVIEEGGMIFLVSPPDGPLRISREDLPEWVREHLVTVGDLHARVGPPGTIATGDDQILLDGKPVARVGDTTVAGGTILDGSAIIFINGVPAATVGSMVVDPIVIGGWVPTVGGPILGNPHCDDPANITTKWGRTYCVANYPEPIGFLEEAARRGDVRIALRDDGEFVIGDAVVIGDDADSAEIAVVIDKGSLVLDRPLTRDHPAGTAVVRIPDEHADLVGPAPDGVVFRDTSPAGDGGISPMLVVIVLAALAAATAGFFWLRRRPTTDHQPPPPPPPDE